MNKKSRTVNNERCNFPGNNILPLHNSKASCNIHVHVHIVCVNLPNTTLELKVNNIMFHKFIYAGCTAVIRFVQWAHKNEAVLLDVCVCV